ncbi:MAG: glycosyltransferase [Candidatus Krumholzibacteriota bacterium]|nr:glycosyltransferase [Candidatus Krumholzibacteriota bacterium]
MSEGPVRDKIDRILFFGGFDRGYPRNSILRKGLKRSGVEVSECLAGSKRKIITRYPVLTSRYFRIKNKGGVILVPDFRHKDVPLAWILSRLTAKKLVFDPLVSRYETRVLDRGDTDQGSLDSWHNRNIDRVSMRMADLVLADTEAHRRFYSEEFGIDKRKIRTLYIGFDDEEFRSIDLYPVTDRFRILFYGSYLPLHGVDVIVRAAKLLVKSPVSFTLIGSGQTYSVARELARDIPAETLVFREKVSSGKLGGLIAEHHLVLGIFGTTTKVDMVIPNKVFQGMATGRAVITADTPAIGELFTGGTDIFLVPKGDPEKLAESIELLRKNETLRGDIARKGSDLVRSGFNPRQVAMRFLALAADAGIL